MADKRLDLFPRCHFHFPCAWVVMADAYWFDLRLRTVWDNQKLKWLHLWRLHIGDGNLSAASALDAVNVVAGHVIASRTFQGCSHCFQLLFVEELLPSLLCLPPMDIPVNAVNAVHPALCAASHEQRCKRLCDKQTVRFVVEEQHTALENAFEPSPSLEQVILLPEFLLLIAALLPPLP